MIQGEWKEKMELTWISQSTCCRVSLLALRKLKAVCNILYSVWHGHKQESCKLQQGSDALFVKI